MGVDKLYTHSCKKQIINFIMKIILLILLNIITVNILHAQTDSTHSKDTTTPILQQSLVDSSLYERISELEKRTDYNKPGEDHFMMAGLATFGFVSNKTKNKLNGVLHDVSKKNSLGDIDHFELSPMFFYRHGKKILVEFEPSFSGNQLGVNWADISYFVAPNVILRAGYLVIPFGFYPKHLAAGWITKLASDPFGITALPTTDYGVEVEGGIQMGTMKLNYDFSLTNGMQLLPDGQLQASGLSDNNNNKTITGRIGWLPFSNSSLELGVSGLSGKVGDASSNFESIRANMYAFDLNFVENIKPFQINIKGQYNIINIGRADYVNPKDSSVYSFNNHTTSGYIQASLRPSFSDNKVVKNFELAARYGNFISPTNSLGGTKQNGWAVGLDYWLSWRTVLKFTYEAIKTINNSRINIDVPVGFVNQSNSMYLQFAIQL